MKNEDTRVAKLMPTIWLEKIHSYNSLGQEELLSARHINGKTIRELIQDHGTVR